MTSAELASFACKQCDRIFDDGRKLGGHVRQSHPSRVKDSSILLSDAAGEDELAAKVLEMWENGAGPYAIVTSLRLHPKFVKEVLKEYDELTNEWKKFREA